MTIDALLLSVAMATAAGLVGCFVIMRRMALAGDALSHVALPGIGLALVLHAHPVFGAAAMLFLGAFLVWWLEARTRIATETIIGVIFSAALAVGSMMTTGEDLIEALFGTTSALSRAELVFGLAASAFVIAFVLTQRNRLIVMLISPDVARTVGISVRLIDLLFLQTFALTIALGLRYLGVLLMGALIIIPAAAAKRVATNLQTMLVTATLVAVGSTIAGSYAAARLHRETGPLIVLAATACFVASLARRTS